MMIDAVPAMAPNVAENQVRALATSVLRVEGEL